MNLRCGRFALAIGRPLIMGIVNLTPDSFSGDGIAFDSRRAINHAFRQIDAGADIIDIGAESSRPGALPTPVGEELERLLPVLDALGNCPVPISVDTYKPEVMSAALRAGAAMINDIYGFRAPGAIAAVADSNCGLCVMHMQGEPLTMQAAPAYREVVAEVAGFLSARVAALHAAGIQSDRICIDPGFGFGKTLAHNLALFRALPDLAAVDAPLLVGVSRKTMLGALTGRATAERLPASIAAAVLAAQRGAAILRVHDVAATLDALKILAAVETASGEH